jgi:mannose-6-phosphate isomerase-like protein (cupin superfamily)
VGSIASVRASPYRKVSDVSAYSIVNLHEIEDSTDAESDVMRRFARSHIDSEHLGVSYFRYAPGYRSGGGHRHREQEEAYVVVGGSGRIKLDDEVIDLKKWDVVRVAPSTARAFEGGPDGIEIIAVGSDRPEGGDGEGIENFWPV